LNEKIKDIIEKSGLYIAHDNKQATDKELEFFAELIVRECAEYADWYQANSRYTDIAKAIKEHFGVKE